MLYILKVTVVGLVLAAGANHHTPPHKASVTFSIPFDSQFTCQEADRATSAEDFYPAAHRLNQRLKPMGAYSSCVETDQRRI